MSITDDIFVEKLTRHCKAFRTHSFAFWKLKALAGAGQVFHQPEHDSCYFVYQNMLFAYLSRDGKIHLPAHELNRFDCIALDETLFSSIADDIHGFTVNRGHKLHYDFTYIPSNNMHQVYEVCAFDFGDTAHFELASEMINQGQGNWMMPENIRKISREPVFDGSLWFFAKERANGRLVGIAISTYDAGMRETDIEWFYVLPEYQGKGAGRFLIEQTVLRSLSRSDDIRVGGTNEFYKKCGFIEKEANIWAAKSGFSLVAPCIQPNILP